MVFLKATSNPSPVELRLTFLRLRRSTPPLRGGLQPVSGAPRLRRKKLNGVYYRNIASSHASRTLGAGFRLSPE